MNANRTGRLGGWILAACVLAGGTAAAQEGGKVELLVALTPPAVSGPLTLEIAFYPLEWGSDGRLRLKEAEVRRMTYDPSRPQRSTAFEVRLKPLIQYQVTVDMIDSETGYPREDVTYLITADDAVGAERRVRLNPGGRTPLLLTLRKSPRERKNGNFLDVFPSSGAPGNFEMALYSGPDQVGAVLRSR